MTSPIIKRGNPLVPGALGPGSKTLTKRAREKIRSLVILYSFQTNKCLSTACRRQLNRFSTQRFCATDNRDLHLYTCYNGYKTGAELLDGFESLVKDSVQLSSKQVENVFKAIFLGTNSKVSCHPIHSNWGA